ncbi:glycosyltransferase [Gramella sp. ASW11-100T]|uniref:Glycosyltransferase n=2 Tax=Christiangramia sediminis TaxID=2881336 RepID=A0A9X1RXU2_9FLAO|nr:glycosyltransferase [Christiangramia sediminis]
MELWFDHVEQVAIASPTTYPEKILLSDFNTPIKLFKLPFFSFKNIWEICKSFLLLPIIFSQIFRSFIWADHVHIRCPGNVGLLACIVQIFFPGKPKSVKYAGNWDPKSKQPWSYNLQKWILGNSFLTRNIKVLVYGNWSNQGENIIPFFTASYSDSEKIEINKDFSPPYRFIFAGTLSQGKRPLMAVKIIHELLKDNFPVKLDIYGGGQEFEKMDTYITENNLTNSVILHGNRDSQILKEAYMNSHFSILPSISEGWPKALAEGMFFGCIPLASEVSCVSWMLGGESRGLLISKEEVIESEFTKETLKKIKDLLKDPVEMREKSLAATEWSQEYTLEKLEDGIKILLSNS